MEKIIKEKIKWPTPMQSIRAKCLECVSFSGNAVKECRGHNCVLYPYRFGKRNKRIKSVNNMYGWGHYAAFSKLKEAGKVFDE